MSRTTDSIVADGEGEASESDDSDTFEDCLGSPHEKRRTLRESNSMLLGATAESLTVNVTKGTLLHRCDSGDLLHHSQIYAYISFMDT